MKLHKRLSINGADILLNRDDIRLDLRSPGRAVFDIETTEPIKGLVVFHAGYSPSELQQVFYGYVESAFAIDKKQSRIFCRELSATLSRLIPLALRNATVADVFKAVSAETGLQFIAPAADYSKKTAPAFYSMGSGYACMDSLGEVYSIPQFMWQQQGDGKLFAGSWKDSFWADKKISLSVDLLSGTGLANSARIPCMPKLRPGVLLEGHGYLTNVQWDGEHQNIEWDSNPWGTRWTNRSSV
jgi:hypothetical protein